MLTAFLVALSVVSATPATKTLTRADNGKTVTIAEHQALRIELSECGSCGYAWRTIATPDPKVLTRRPNLHKRPTCQPPCTGGTSTTVFRYTGKATGRTTLRLGYFGPGRPKPSNRFRITVRVRDSGGAFSGAARSAWR
jgi:predicted secreted protein